MSSKLAELIARDPRFRVIGSLDVRLARAGSNPVVAQHVVIVNLSRCGVRLHADVSVNEGDLVLVELSRKDREIHRSIAALVCWSKKCADDQYDIGCQFRQEIDWEFMGELFLHEIISPNE